jgi:hypothetical protein
LAQTSDLFDVFLLLLHRTNLTSWEKLLLAPKDKNCQLGKIFQVEATIQRNSFKGLQFKRSTQMTGLLQI